VPFRNFQNFSGHFAYGYLPLSYFQLISRQINNAGLSEWSPALFFVVANVYGLFYHSRKIPAVAVATDNTKLHLPPMDCPDERTGAIANSQRSGGSKRLIYSNWLAFFGLLFLATQKK
jgi:hypothetical protein